MFVLRETETEAAGVGEGQRERERDRQSEWGVGSEREGDTESDEGSRLQAVNTEPDAGLELVNREIMT